MSSSPAASAVVPEAPAQVVITFSEGVRKVPGRSGDRPRRLAGRPGRADFPGRRGHHPVDPSGGRGTYLVSYRVISADSHPVSGAFTYSVGAPSEPPTDSGSDNRANPVTETAVKVAKYAGYVGLLLLVGPALVLAALWPRRLSRRGPARLAWTGLGLLAAATVAEVWLQVPYVNGGGLFDVTGSGLVTCSAAPTAPPTWSGWVCSRRRRSCSGRCSPARSAVPTGSSWRSSAARRCSPGRWPGTRRPRPRPRCRWWWTRCTWAAWRCGWAAWSCSRCSCCVRPTSGSWTRSCRSGPAGPRSRWPRCCWPARCRA
ncbi:copper resistance CopC family protein [Micromonospora sp. BRA006-A]|nr:copper resistance CopC family protein [Micromonospora sp. BRA006-A]